MTNLQNFTVNWVENYETKVSKLNLFKPEFVQDWNLAKKQKFVKLFYHIRGHFYKFLWNLGKLAPNQDYKQIILDNYKEEFGGDNYSHEELYSAFARDFGVNIEEELIAEKFNSEFIKKFNQGHIKFILANNWNTGWSAFAAYEKLDNTDYNYLSNLAKNLGSSDTGLQFFKVHQNAGHYDSTSELLEKTWETDPKSVKIGFNFIAKYQLEMWRELEVELA